MILRSVIVSLGFTFILLGSENLSARNFETTMGSQTLARLGAGMATQNEFSTSVSSIRYEVHEWVENQTQQVNYYDCDSEVGDGRGDWKNFYTIPYDKKAKALEDAILGVGPKRAPLLVKYFDKGKPRSWNAFSQVMKGAESEIPGIYHAVVIRYGEKNAINLGYFSEACGWKSKTITTPVLQRQKNLAGSSSQSFQIIVANPAPLLAGEREEFTLSYDSFTDSLGIESDYYKYGVSKSKVNEFIIYTLSPLERKLVSPKLTQLKASLVVRDRKVVLSLKDLAYDPDLAASGLGSMVVHIQVRYKKNWLNLGGTVLKESDLKLKSDGSEMFFETGVSTSDAALKGKAIWVRYWYGRVDSAFFNTGLSNQATTDSVKF